MGASLRSRLQMDARRAQLLEEGLRLFNTRPYDEVSIDDIAAAANVSKGLLYHYFGSKRDFYVAIVRDAAAQLLAAIVPDEAVTPAAARGYAGLSAYLQFVEERADAFVALMTGGNGADPEIAAILDHTRQAIVGRLLLEIGLTEPRPAFRLAVRSWVGAVEAASLDWLATRSIPRETLLLMLLGSLHGTLSAAVELDPAAGVVLPPPQALQTILRLSHDA